MSKIRQAVLFAMLASAIGAAPASGAYFAFSDSSALNGTLTPQAAANKSADAGATAARMDVGWNRVESTRGTYKFAPYDAVYSAMLGRGIRPLWVLNGTPDWARDPGVSCSADCQHYPPARTELAAWRAFARQVALRYPQVAGIEIWNEPNHNTSWYGGLDPARYTELLVNAYDAIKAVAPGTKVISGGLAPALDRLPTATSYPVRGFVNEMYANGAKGHIDAIGLHPYPFDYDFWRAYKTMSHALEARDIAGDNVPLWLTELGVTTSNGTFGPVDQAVILASLWDHLRQRSDVLGFAVNSLIETMQYGYWSPDRGYGVIETDGDPKPAYCMLAKYNNTSYSCPLFVTKPKISDAWYARWNAQDLVQRAADAARAYHLAAGSYRTVTAAKLHAIDGRISATPLLGPERAGSLADPSRMYITPIPDGRDGVTICNASKADRVYCIFLIWGMNWNYGSTTGSVSDASGATYRRDTTTW